MLPRSTSTHGHYLADTRTQRAILYYFVATSVDHILHDSDACHMSIWHVDTYLHTRLYVLHDIGIADHMETTRHHWPNPS